MTSAYGLAGPKGMDPGVVHVLHGACKAAHFDMPLEYHDTEDCRSFIPRRAEYETGMAQRLHLRID